MLAESLPNDDFFTRNLNKFIYRFAFRRMPFLMVFLFVFNRQIDLALSFLGYKPDFVSYFPFLRALYAHLTSTIGINNVSTAYFHVLDACLWVALAMWGTRLTAGLFFLRQYDELYQGIKLRMARTPRDQMCIACLGGIIISAAPFFLTWVLMQPKTLNDPEIILIVKWLPIAYFFALSATYFYCANWLVELSLFLFWTILRSKSARSSSLA